MNIFDQVLGGSRFVVAALASFALSMTSGCSSLPSMDDTEAVSLVTRADWYGDLEVDVDGNPELRPGAMALDSLQVAGACEFCFLLAIPMIPIAAATGAAITAAETLPEEDAHELNRVSAAIVSSVNLQADLRDSMENEAARQGIILTNKNPDALLDIVMTDFGWDVSVGNNVALKAKFVITGVVKGKRGYETITYRSERADVDHWLSEGGKHIHQSLTQLLDDASRKVWFEILDGG